MTASIPAGLFVEPVTVETYAGQGAYGDSYAAAVTVLGHVYSGRNSAGGVQVRSSSSGDVTVAALRVALPNPARLADGSGTVDPTAVLLPESRVTSGTVVGTVRQVEPYKVPGMNVVVYVSAELT